MKFISTSDAPRPLGHYSQAVCYGGLCYVSGLLPVTKDGEIKRLSFERQSELVLEHAIAILHSNGLHVSDIVQARVYVTDVGNWSVFDAKYAEVLAEHKPARAVVPVPELHHGFDVELELVAQCERT